MCMEKYGIILLNNSVILLLVNTQFEATKFSHNALQKNSNLRLLHENSILLLNFHVKSLEFFTVASVIPGASQHDQAAGDTCVIK